MHVRVVGGAGIVGGEDVRCNGVGSGGLDGGGGGGEIHGDDVVFAVCVGVKIIAMGVVVRGAVRRNWYCGCGYYCVIDRRAWCGT